MFLMLFLWKYIDDLVGKGLEWHVVARLLFFSLADLIPMALPLAVLLSSLMTFGNLSESYEMVALKASGVSIYRALLPAFLIIVFLSVLTFYVSNIVIPKANLEAKSLLWDIRNKKPAFDIKEGIFYNGIDGCITSLIFRFDHFYFFVNFNSYLMTQASRNMRGNDQGYD